MSASLWPLIQPLAKLDSKVEPSRKSKDYHLQPLDFVGFFEFFVIFLLAQNFLLWMIRQRKIASTVILGPQRPKVNRACTAAVHAAAVKADVRHGQSLNKWAESVLGKAAHLSFYSFSIRYALFRMAAMPVFSAHFKQSQNF
jgi:Photosynthetic reaction centre protein